MGLTGGLSEEVVREAGGGEFDSQAKRRGNLGIEEESIPRRAITRGAKFKKTGIFQKTKYPKTETKRPLCEEEKRRDKVV